MIKEIGSTNMDTMPGPHRSEMGGWKIGFNNACLMTWELGRLFEWAADHHWPVVELHGSPRYRHVDWGAIADGRENPVAEARLQSDVDVAGIMCGLLPFLSPDPSERQRAASYLEVLLRAANRCEIPVVSTFTGRDPSKTLEQNLVAFAEVFPPLVDMAERYGVRLAFENCPMYEFWPNDANIAVSPSMWREIFALVPSEMLGLNLDPSHLVWQGIDSTRAVHEFRDRIWLVQAKDTERLPGVLADEGMLTLRWWRHRVPGQGDIDWTKFLTALFEASYSGPLIIEHEDPVWSGTDERVIRGLEIGRANLARFTGSRGSVTAQDPKE